MLELNKALGKIVPTNDGAERCAERFDKKLVAQVVGCPDIPFAITGNQTGAFKREIV